MNVVSFTQPVETASATIQCRRTLPIVAVIFLGDLNHFYEIFSCRVLVSPFVQYSMGTMRQHNKVLGRLNHFYLPFNIHIIGREGGRPCRFR